MQKDTLFDSRLSEREFGSYLVHVPSFLKWIESKSLNFPETNPQIDTYRFVQVEALLCAIERPFQSMTNEQAFIIVQSNPELRDEKAAREPGTAKWLLHADAHLQWRKLIVAAVKTGELKLLDYASKLTISGEALNALLVTLPGSDQLVESDAIQGGGAQAATEPLQVQTDAKAEPLPVAVTEQSVDEELAALFDGVKKQQLAAMFHELNSDSEKDLELWTSYIKEANHNGLDAARTSHGKYNPYKAGYWWLNKKGPTGWRSEQLDRRLAKNLPARSKGQESRLTGDDYKNQ
jgi:hypothetical protein